MAAWLSRRTVRWYAVSFVCGQGDVLAGVGGREPVNQHAGVGVTGQAQQVGDPGCGGHRGAVRVGLVDRVGEVAAGVGQLSGGSDEDVDVGVVRAHDDDRRPTLLTCPRPRRGLPVATASASRGRGTV